MKLAIIRTSYAPLNTQSYNIQEIGLAKGLLNFSISTDIYSRFNNINEETVFYSEENNQIKLIPIKGISILQKITYFPDLIKQVATQNYDIVQVHEDSQLMTPFILKRLHKRGVKTVLYQGMYTDYRGINRVYQLLLDFLFQKTIKKNSDIIFVKTDLAKQYLLKKRFSTVVVLSIGLDFSKKQTPYQSQEILRSFKSRYDNLLLYVGKIETRRNPLFLMDLFFDIRSKRTQNIGMVIVGDGPLQIMMEEYAQKLGIKEHVLFIKKVSNEEIHEIYKSCDLFVLPTNNEIYGMVIMEALLYGLPVISTPEAGPLAILSDERLGVCRPLNINDWSKVILKYLRDNNDKDREFRRQIILNNYDWNKIAQQYYNVVSKNAHS